MNKRREKKGAAAQASGHDLPQKARQTARAEASAPGERRHRALYYTIAVLLLLAAFGVLTWFVRGSDYFPIDLKITLAVQSWSSPFADALWRVVSWAGYGAQSAIIPIAIIGLLILFGLYWEALAAAITAVCVEGSNLLLKAIVHRPRPAADLVHVIGTFKSYSFPSGHVMFYSGFYGFMFFLSAVLLKPSWKRALLLILFGGEVLLVGASRIYLGAHWASDVLGAYLMGITELLLFILLYRWGKPRFFVRQPVAGESAGPRKRKAARFD